MDVVLALALACMGVDVGSVVNDFTLPNPQGGEINLDQETKNGLVVIAFIGTHCPMSKRYAPRLQEIFDSYRDRGVRFLAISSNQQDSLADVVRFRRDYQLTFPVVKDEASRVANELGAERTPEVYLVDRNRRIRYRGRIDNQYENNSEQQSPTQQHLVEAIGEVLGGRAVRTPTTEAFGCRIGRAVQEVSEPTVFWHSEIATLFRRHCVQCHRPGGSAPFPLTRYEDVVGWGDTIREIILQKKMPPWFADPHTPPYANSQLMTEEESNRILEWVDNGCPQGDASKDDFPAPKSSGWQLAKDVDYQFPMSDSDIEIPAQGKQDFRYFIVDTGLKERIRVSGMEIHPTNRIAVRNVSVFVVPPSLDRVFPNLRDLVSSPEFYSNLLCWYTPDCLPTTYPSDVAREIPAGAKLVFRVLYRPIGRIEHDRTSLGLIRADDQKVKRIARTIPLIALDVNLPGGGESVTVSRNHPISGPMLLLSVIPSLSLHGKSFEASIEQPDGESESLVSIPRFPYYWQYEYRLAEPLPLRMGAVIDCRAEFMDTAVRDETDSMQELKLALARPYTNDAMITFLEVVPPPVVETVAYVSKHDPTQDISMAIGGLAATTMICLMFLWLKPASTNAEQRPAPPTAS